MLSKEKHFVSEGYLFIHHQVGAELITNLIGKDGEGKQPEDLKPAATGWIQEKEICSS